MTDDDLEKMGITYLITMPHMVYDMPVGMSVRGCVIDKDRLKAGVEGAKQILEIIYMLDLNIESSELCTEAIQNLHIFLGEDKDGE